jgi:DNA-nicking Smr family endonuclease
MKAPRGLSTEEAELWARVAQTVKPLAGRNLPAVDRPRAVSSAKPKARDIDDIAAFAKAMASPPRTRAAPEPVRKPAPSLDRQTLDSSWERKLGRAAVSPDFTLDLHGASLNAAHSRLDHGLAQARAMGARLVLVITGKPRPVDAADRASSRGVIRAKILDWLAAGVHAGAIAAIRPAHRKHGGAGALYIVLRRVP